MKAIVTGSSRGLGFQIAKSFVEMNIDVAITARKTESLEKATNELKALGSNSLITGACLDFLDAESVSEYCRKIKDEFGEIDVLVNNAGMYHVDSIGEQIDQHLHSAIEVNVLSAIRMSNEMLDLLTKSDQAHIINIISVAAQKPRIDAVSYSISKAALRSYTDMQREALRTRGIKVTGIYPGPMNTSSWDGEDTDTSSMIQVKDVSDAILQILTMSGNSLVEELVIDVNQTL